jgi:hypothetical protein
MSELSSCECPCGLYNMYSVIWLISLYGHKRSEVA